MSIFSSSKSVLLLNDDGVSVYNVLPTNVEYVDSIHWGAENFGKDISDLIKNRCASRPVVIINDMVEQHYRKERIPKASVLDRANLIKKRVAGAFPSYPIRASIKLKEKAPQLEGQRAGDIFLFAAIPQTEGIRKTISAIQAAQTSIAAFCLLPIEATSMIQMLGKKLSKVNPSGAEWIVFAGQHNGGTLRQIVTKNGELALTRITPITSNENDLDAWCTEVAGELRGTMGYLSRFGFSSADELSVIVTAPNDLGSRLSSKIDFDCDLNVLSSQEAADLLGLKIGVRRSNEHNFADILHVATIGRKKTYTMPLETPQIENINNPLKLIGLAYATLAVVGLFLGYQAVTSFLSLLSYSDQIGIANQELSSAKEARDVEAEKKKKVGLDYMLVEKTTEVFKTLDIDTMRPLPVFEKIGKAIGSDLHIKMMSVKPTLSQDIATSTPSGDPATDPNVSKDQKPINFDIVVSFVFPPDLNPDLGVKKVGEIEARLKQTLPDFKVTVIKQVADLSYTGNFVGEASNASGTQGSQNKSYEAQILIRGALQ